MLEVN
jgi:hypothetical protein